MKVQETNQKPDLDTLNWTADFIALNYFHRLGLIRIWAKFRELVGLQLPYFFFCSSRHGMDKNHA